MAQAPNIASERQIERRVVDIWFPYEEISHAGKFLSVGRGIIMVTLIIGIL